MVLENTMLDGYSKKINAVAINMRTINMRAINVMAIKVNGFKPGLKCDPMEIISFFFTQIEEEIAKIFQSRHGEQE